MLHRVLIACVMVALTGFSVWADDTDFEITWPSSQTMPVVQNYVDAGEVRVLWDGSLSIVNVHNFGAGHRFLLVVSEQVVEPQAKVCNKNETGGSSQTFEFTKKSDGSKSEVTLDPGECASCKGCDVKKTF